MRIIFMGTPDFSVGTLKALKEAGHEIVLCVTQPDKPRGRGGKMTFSPVKECAQEMGIPVFQPVRIRREENVAELRKYPADVMVVIAFGQILSKEILNMTPYGCINIHASLLPKYRGAAPIQWAVIDGERESGVTIMQMDEGLDTGDMILEKKIALAPDETGGSLHDKLAVLGAQAIVEALPMIEDGTVVRTPQGKSTTAYAKMINKEMGHIDWRQPAAVIERLIRGLAPWPGTYSSWHGKVLKIWQARAVSEDTKGTPGEVIRICRDSFAVQTGEGTLEILECQLPGKKRMNAADFLRGNAVEAQDVLE